ncbi:MAG: hypothetical protein RRA63_05315 [Candidatus Calescibacterium sp.]|jgi:hypothetical protein|nr:hypothetical protein [Candidatus Calescibacterium sp.]
MKISKEKFEKNISEILRRHLCLNIKKTADIVVAIPTLADEEIFTTLESLSKCKLPNSKRVLAIVLINESEKAEEKIRTKNKEIFDKIKSTNFEIETEVRYIKGIPEKLAGVGFARRVLMDEAICLFKKEYDEKFKERGNIAEFMSEKFIFSLDSDCTVSENYFSAVEILEIKNADFGVLSFAHRFSEEKEIKKAGILWEIFLRYWRDSLRVFSYKNAFYPIGSLFLFRATPYIVSMGMNIRQAGEDFYFLQKIIPLAKIVDIPVYVFPKAEPSQRTPFGTGREIQLYISGEKERLEKVWNFKSFEQIGEIMRSIDDIFSGEIKVETFKLFLDENPKYKEQLERIKIQSKTKEDFRKKFEEWFNPFKVFKFLRFTEKIFPKSPIYQEVHKLTDKIKRDFKFEFEKSGLTQISADELSLFEIQLEFLRSFDEFLFHLI